MQAFQFLLSFCFILLRKNVSADRIRTLTDWNQFCDKGENKDCQNIVTRTKNSSCIDYDVTKFGPQNRSVFVIDSKGRLGNHLMAFSLIVLIGKDIPEVDVYITQDTFEFMNQYFEDVTSRIPVFQQVFCNGDKIGFEDYEESINVLLEDKEVRKGRRFNLWPWGYESSKNEHKSAGPAEELTEYINDNREYVRSMLKFKPKYAAHTENVKRKVVEEMKEDRENIVFVGIHSRRTDYITFMKDKFDKKNPYNKNYYISAMDYFREDHEGEKRVAFLYVSDDLKWGKKYLRKQPDIFFVGTGDTEDKDSIGKDLALLASCESTITTWGSFSMWAALLSGGEYYSEYGVIVPGDKQNVGKKRKKKQKSNFEEMK